MSDIFTSIIDETLTAQAYLICIASALACGLITAFSALYKSRISKGFFISLVLLPVIVATVITMVNGNIGTGVAVMGAFSLVRFRSAAGKAKDIVLIFIAMSAGLTCAAGYVVIALMFTALVCAIMLVLSSFTFRNECTLDLKITVPESLNYCDAFNDLFEKYTSECRFVGAKTTAMGSLYRLSYNVRLKNSAAIKEFMDDIRCRNGNLEVMISESVAPADEL